MDSSFKSLLKQKLVNTFFPHVRRSYSQSGEDIIITNLFARLGIETPTYLDIGANEPVAISNTYRLYSRGSKGVCVEPNTALYNKLKRKRKKDTCINAGVAFDEKKEANFYIFPKKVHGLNTFSKDEADFWEQTGNTEIGRHKVQQIVKIPLVSINELMEKHFSPHPNFISIDVEGLDLQILKSMDFEKYKPETFCVETLMYGVNNRESKNKELISFLESKGYFVYADTYINTIFCRKDAYKNISG